MNSEDTSNLYSLTNSNDGYNNASVIQIRLNTEPILDQIHHFLRGTIEYVDYEEKNNLPTVKVKQISDVKANEKGIHAIMGWVRAIFNPQVVQGNFSKKDYELNDYLYNLRMDLAEYLMVNLYNFDIKESEYEGIIDMIMSVIKPFMTRTLENKERDSYTHSIKHTESSSQTTNKGSGMGFRLPGM